MADQISFVDILTPRSKGPSAFCHDAFGWDVCEPAGSMGHRVMDPAGDNGVKAATSDPIVDGDT